MLSQNALWQLGRFRPEPTEALPFAGDTAVVAPALLDVEVRQALRRAVALKLGEGHPNHPIG